MEPCCPSGASSSWRIAHPRAERGWRAAVLDAREQTHFRLRMSEEGSGQRAAAAASRASHQKRLGPPGRSGLDSYLLLIIDPEPDQTVEMGQKPLTFILWIGHVDRFGEHAVEVRR